MIEKSPEFGSGLSFYFEHKNKNAKNMKKSSCNLFFM